jgi:hypothetical protein
MHLGCSSPSTEASDLSRVGKFSGWTCQFCMGMTMDLLESCLSLVLVSGHFANKMLSNADLDMSLKTASQPSGQMRTNSDVMERWPFCHAVFA